MSSVTAKERSPLVYASSLAIDVVTMALVPEADTITSEVGIVLERIRKQFAAEGLEQSDIVNTTCYLSDESYLDEFVQAYDAAFAPAPYPVNTTVFLGLAGNCRVQIEAVAVRA